MLGGASHVRDSRFVQGLVPYPQIDCEDSAPCPSDNRPVRKTICAARHTFRADETFQMLETLFREKYNDIKFIPNTEMPDTTSATPEEAAQMTKVLKEKGCDVLLTGNGA